ncbi:MAG: hypothetical protein NDJ89_18255 [Oligoflexia bacterium]|nr:hypothetical protein [Oligoflexia bacterium]
MRDDYKLTGPTVKVELQLEKEIAEGLEKMEKYSRHSRSELVNTALKRFIAAHKDFFPPEDRK